MVIETKVVSGPKVVIEYQGCHWNQGGQSTKVVTGPKVEIGPKVVTGPKVSLDPRLE